MSRPPREATTGEAKGGGSGSAPPKSSGYVDVGELDLYHERHGDGPPLVLLHGAFGTIESCFAGLLPTLAARFEVIAVELQGHGRTRDADRPLSYEDMAADTAALLEALNIPRAHFVGWNAASSARAASGPGARDINRRRRRHGTASLPTRLRARDSVGLCDGAPARHRGSTAQSIALS